MGILNSFLVPAARSATVTGDAAIERRGRVARMIGWLPSRVSIRTRILLLQIAVGLTVVSLFAAGLLTIHSFDAYRARGALAHSQLDALTSLSGNADAYSERMSELLTAGTGDGAMIARLHSELAQALTALQRATQEEHDFLAARQPENSAEEEFQRVARLHQLYADMNLRFEALLAMRNAGQPEIAIRIFQEDVATGLDDEFERLIAVSMQEEMQEIAAADREAGILSQRLAWLIGGTSALVLLGTIAASLFLYRSIVRPISRLGAGAVAIGQGNLSQRIGALGSDEFGLLANRFDDMATQLEAQQTLLLAAHSDLEAQVRARTKELEAANASLEDRDRSRARFLAEISHELRTPLTVLRGEAEVTLRGRPSRIAPYREALGRIVEQAQELGRLVEDLLMLARAETNEINFEKTVLDLSEVVADAVREGAILGRPRRVTIEAKRAPSAFVEGDRQRLKQVLMIVLDNAVKYSVPESAVALSLVAVNDTATIAVTNRTEHFSGEDLRRILDRLDGDIGHRPKSATRNGLGLSIARWMLEKQGGSISLAKKEPDLMRVTIRLPLSKAEHATGSLPQVHAMTEVA